MIQKYFQSSTTRDFSIAMVWINGGSGIDHEGKKGINKILSSLLARGCNGFTNMEFSEYIDSHGAELNLETLEDGILISLKSLNEHFNKLLPLLKLLINEPLLLKSQFQNVKKTTIDLLKKENENPYNIAFEKWRNIVYFKHHYAYNPSGYEEDILSITYDNILSEYENFKNRNKYIISNNSNIDSESFGFFNKKNYETKYKSIKQDRKNIERFVSTNRESNQVILMLGNQTCSLSSNEYLPLKILESHLSYGMSSLLFKLFRENNGLTYDIGVFHPIRKQNSPFLIYFSVSNRNAILAFKILIELWKKLLTNKIPDEEFNLAKVKLKSSFLISNQSLEEILQRKIKMIGFNLRPDLDVDYLNKIEDITSEYTLKITQKYLSKPFLSISGNKKISNEIYELWIKNS